MSSYYRKSDLVRRWVWLNMRFEWGRWYLTPYGVEWVVEAVGRRHPDSQPKAEPAPCSKTVSDHL